MLVELFLIHELIQSLVKRMAGAQWQRCGLLLLGWATLLSNLAPFALLPAFVVYMNHFQIRPEERALGSLFAQEYQTYHARVRRWI